MNEIDKITRDILKRVEAITITPEVKSGKKKRRKVLEGRHSTLTRRKISKSLTGRTLDDSHKQNISQAMCQRWEVTSPTGKKQFVYRLKEFCQEHGLSYCSMVNVARGHIKKHQGGWVCKKVV